MTKKLILQVLALLVGSSGLLQAQSWSQMGRSIRGVSADDQFGISSTMNQDGTRFAAGAPQSLGERRGYVRAFYWADPNWAQSGDQLFGDAVGDRFGHSVSINDEGNRLAVSAPSNDITGTDAGQVKVFELDDSTQTWVQLGRNLLGRQGGETFGSSVSLNAAGTRVAVGVSGSNAGLGIAKAGGVRVYELQNDRWIQLGNDIQGQNTLDEFGTAVSINAAGDRVAIGAPKNDSNGNDSGEAYVYEFQNGDWVQLGSDIGGEAADDLFAETISINANGNRIVAGAPENDGRGGESGHARVYEFQNGNWVQLGSDIDGEASRDFSGRSVGMDQSGDRIIIGAPGNDGVGNLAGHARIYEWDGTQWSQVGGDIDSENASALAGRSSDISGSGFRVVLTASSASDVLNKARAGRASCHQVPGPCTVSIPDANFKAALIANTDINTNGNSDIECDEASAYSGGLDLSDVGITDLTGIEAFDKISELNINNNNQLVGLPLGQNIQLTKISFINCGAIASIDVSNSSLLTELVGGRFANPPLPIRNLDLTNNPQLRVLSLRYVLLSNIDISQNLLLEECTLAFTKIREVDVSKNTALTKLELSANIISAIDLSQNVNLRTLALANNQLTSLNIDQNTKLQDLYLTRNQLNSINLSNNTQLAELYIGQNQLSSLDLSNNTRLYDLNCSDNQIPTLKVDHLTGLEYLTASKNQFTSMDLSKNSRLQSINLSDNRLTALDIRNGNNADISTGGFAVRDNPDLTCIAVDDLAHANASWTQIDPQMSFSTSCLTSSQERQVGRLLIYPNPTHDQLTVSLPKGMLLRQLVLTDMHGREVVRGTQTSISLADIAAGFYVLKMETDEGQFTYGKIRKW